ncbi:MAG TPA: RNase adapter RapZ [Acidimicrobiales bacterium]|nr:RNase adapter RapZ [Acidimicrobiales bacterium]
MVEFVIVTGMSGAGRSQAGATFEDLGWFVVDNLPTALILDFAELSTRPGSGRDRVALVVGRDIEQLGELVPAVKELRRRGVTVRTLFLDARDEVLVRRFEGTRRRHPLGREKILEAIAVERERLVPIRETADIVIETTDLNVNQLRDRLIQLFMDRGDEPMQITVVSFGFKYGLPPDVDNVFDARFLPNPHWVDELRDLTGLDQPVRDFVIEGPGAAEFIERVDDLLGFLLPCYAQEGKSYMGVAIGCTGGRHRSVVLAEEIAGRIRKRGYGAAVFHRDISR